MEIDETNTNSNNNENNLNNIDNNSIIFKSTIDKDKSLIISKEVQKLIPKLDINLQTISFNIPFKYLNLIKEYCEHHNFIKPNPITMPLPYNDFSKCIKDKWDYNFIMKLNIKECLEFVNYLEEINCESNYGQSTVKYVILNDSKTLMISGSGRMKNYHYPDSYLNICNHHNYNQEDTICFGLLLLLL